MQDDDKPVRLASNEFWGKRSGVSDGRLSSDPPGRRMPMFPGRRGNILAHKEGQGPNGHKARWNPGRALRRNFGKHGLRKRSK